MAGESITFDFLSRGADSLASDFRKTGDNAALAAKGARLCADALDKQRKAADVSAGATIALAKADKILADAEEELAGRAALADEALRGQGDAAKKAGRDAEVAAGGVGSLAGSGGIPGGGMGAAIAAGVALAPVLVTLGVGFAGLGAAAVGIAKPIADAAGKTGGLAANLKSLDPAQQAVAKSILGLGKEYDQFQKALQPQILTIFNQGIKIAGGLLKDIQPVAQATGKAFSGFLGQLDKEFSSGQFQDFFKFMAQTAAPDMQLLGNLFIALAADLPPLLEALQPIAEQMLSLTTNLARATGALADFGKSNNAVSKSVGTNTGVLGFLSKAVANVTSFMKPGGVTAGAFKSVMDGIPGSAGAAAASLDKVTHATLSQAAASKAAAAALSKLTGQYNAALSPLLAYTNAIVTQRTDSAALSAALKVSHDRIGLNTTVQRASFSAAQTYIQDLLNTASAAVKSHQGIDAQIGSIRGALPLLQNVKGGTRQYWQEVSTLVGWLHKLQAIKLIQEAIHVNASGVWSVTPGKIGLPGGTAGGPFAFGGQVTGGIPGRDSVLIRAMPGEVVVPTNMVRAGAVDHLRGRLPGFASGGVVGSYGPGAVGGLPRWTAMETNATVSAVARSTAAALVAGLKAAASAAVTASRVPNVGSGVARWAPLVRQALAMEHLNPGYLADVLYQMQTESGGNPNAINLTDINAQEGHPSIGLMQVIAGTFARWHWPGTSNNIYDPLANIAAALNYAAHGRGFGSGPGQIGSGHGYALGGLVQAMASGGQVGQQGSAYLKAWQTRHGGGFGAAWGPTVLNQQIPEMAAAVQRARALSGASGLSPGQHRFWAGAAADETRRLGVLRKELTTERAWRTQLGINELGLDKQIRAAGNLPSLAGAVRGWKTQMGRDKARVTAISKMLGYSDAYLASHKPPPPGPVLPTVTHTYGGDVANNLGTVLQAALGPFTGAARGGMVFDQGGTLRPGYNGIWNMTGRPEPLVPARGGAGKLQIEWVGGNGGDDLERWIRKNVRIRGGGNVQKAWGSH